MPTADVHRFRLALIDDEALDRTQEYLALEGVRTDRFAFAQATGSRQAIEAIRTSARDRVQRIRSLIAWPAGPSELGDNGFLAGIFDAEGSANGVVRIANTDPEMIGWTSDCLRRLGFDAIVEGFPSHGAALRAPPRRSVRAAVAVHPHGRSRDQPQAQPRGPRVEDGCRTRCRRDRAARPGARELYDITTGTGDFIANGVVSHNCFARPTHEYLGLNAGRDFEKEIVVKVNAPEVLRRELARPSWKGEHVAMGTNTDPYQWVEGRYKLMRGIWEALRDARNPCSILTKSPLRPARPRPPAGDRAGG